MFRKDETAARPGLTVAAVGVVQFLVSLDLSVVNLGLPEIASGLGFGGVDVTWVIHAYALAFGGLLLLGGKLADRHGRRRVLLGGLGLFALASLLGGFAQEQGQLIAARAAQGIGAAALAPAALAILTVSFPSGRARAQAFGVWSAMNAAGGALGVLVGGVLTEYAGWRWVMWVNVPMAVLAVALAWWGVAADRPVARHARPDVLGAVLGTAGMTALVYGIVGTDQHGWASPVTLGSLVAASVLLVAFVLVQRATTRDAVLPLALFRLRTVSGANAYNLLLGAAMASAFYFMSLYLQDVLGHGPALAGLMFLPFALGVVAGSFLAIRLGSRMPPRSLLIWGGLLTAAGFAWFGRIGADGTFLADVLGPSLVTSIGFGLCLGPVVATATVGVEERHSGVASGVLNTSRQLGASLGLAALGTAAAARAGGSTNGSIDVEALTGGYALGFNLGAVLLGVAVLVAALVLPRPTGRTTSRSTTSRSTTSRKEYHHRDRSNP